MSLKISDSSSSSVADYPRKSFYQDRSVAASYFEKRFGNPKARKEHAALKRAFEAAFQFVPVGRTVLDLPCGTGRFTDFFCDKGYRYVGVDVSKEMLDVLRQEHKRSEESPILVRCEGEVLAFKDDAVDCVVSVRLFHWLPTPVKRKMLKEIRRVSKRWLVVEVRHVKSMRRMARMKSFVQKAFGHDAAAPVLDADIAEADWREAMRVPVRGTRHWVAVYEKVP